MGLEPVVIVENYNQKDTAALQKLCVDLCVACGSCTYVCRPNGRSPRLLRWRKTGICVNSARGVNNGSIFACHSLAPYPGHRDHRGLMGTVLVGLAPCIVASGLIFGYGALVTVAVTVLACVAFEYLYCLLRKKPNPVGDLSACVTGVILALNVPAGMPLWICVVGAFVAIVVVKQLYGGLGYNFANPALVARIVLFVSFASRMTTYVYPDLAVDALASATPLQVVAEGGVQAAEQLSLLDLFLGNHGGMLGETCVLAILLGLALMLAFGTIEITIPASITVTVFLCSWAATGSVQTALVEIMSGGLLFGAVFMATDYVTSRSPPRASFFMAFSSASSPSPSEPLAV